MKALSEPQRAALAAWELATKGSRFRYASTATVFPTKYSAANPAELDEATSFRNRYLRRSMDTMHRAGILETHPSTGLENLIRCGNPLKEKYKLQPERRREILRRWVAALTRPDRQGWEKLNKPGPGTFRAWVDFQIGPELFDTFTREQTRARWLAALDAADECALTTLESLRSPSRRAQ